MVQPNIFILLFSELHKKRYKTCTFVENKLLNPIQTISLFSILSPAKLLSHFYTIIDGTFDSGHRAHYVE